MRLLPRTLLWRTFLAIALVIVVSVATWFQIYRIYDREPRARQIAQMVVSVVNLTRTALVTARPELRRELLLDLADDEGIRVYPAEPDERIVEPASDRPLLKLVNTELRRQLGEETRIAYERDGLPGFYVSFRIDDDQYWVMLPRSRVERKLTMQWLGWGSLAVALALAAAYFIVFRIKRPLAALTGAAAEIGRGRTPAPLDESGPEEIATLANAFNQMSRDLTQLEEDRALILAGVSHDLRTPLARLRLGIEMGETDAQLKNGMVSDIDEMDRIIGQFLDFARAAGGEPAESADLAEIAGEVLTHYAELGTPVHAELTPLPRRPLRRMAIRRALSNLIDNAFRYAGGEVTVNVYAQGMSAVLEVLDRGPGIPAGEIERLKQPFTRLESARSNAGGSGLGLAIVDRVARLHGGSFELLARAGCGLCARITLPG
jgi:two-component system osmolarity sensor histidine kinase EnvZ